MHPLRKVLVYDNRDLRNGIKINEGRYLNEEDVRNDKKKTRYFLESLFSDLHPNHDRRIRIWACSIRFTTLTTGMKGVILQNLFRKLKTSNQSNL